MKRPIWEGNISFGLVNVPVTLYPAEKKSNLRFHLMDKRDHARIQYARINASTGKKVALSDIVKAYEYEKGDYVVIDQEAVANILPKNGHLIEIQHFIDKKSLSLLYFERPYYLVPAKFGQKGYVLLRETLKKTNKLAMTRVMIKSYQYLAAILPHDQVLILYLLRFPEEVEKLDTLAIPASATISPTEMRMSEKLVNSMTAKWSPKSYRNQNRALIMEWINRRIKGKKTVSEKKAPSPAKENVVDFMQLLEKSLKKKSATKKPPSKSRKAH